MSGELPMLPRGVKVDHAGVEVHVSRPAERNGALFSAFIATSFAGLGTLAFAHGAVAVAALLGAAVLVSAVVAIRAALVFSTGTVLRVTGDGVTVAVHRLGRRSHTLQIPLTELEVRAVELHPEGPLLLLAYGEEHQLFRPADLDVEAVRWLAATVGAARDAARAAPDEGTAARAALHALLGRVGE